MTSKSKSLPAQSIADATDTETPREWIPPRLRRFATSSAQNSAGGAVDNEGVS
jgi:hypothetical protein